MCACKKIISENGKYFAALVEIAVWEKMVLCSGMPCPVVCDADLPQSHFSIWDGQSTSALLKLTRTNACHISSDT